MKRVLITGITGYIGSRLARQLLPDHEVYGLVRSPLSNRYISDIQDKLKLLPCNGSYASIAAAVDRAKPELVYHLAAYYTKAHGPEETPKLIQSNITLGGYLLEAMVSCGSPHIVYASTAIANSAYCVPNLYAAAKRAFSELLAYYTNAGLLRSVTLLLSDTYGPGDRRPKILNIAKRAAQAGETLRLSAGDQIFDVVHVDDVARAFQLAGKQLEKNSQWINETFQLYAENPLTLRKTVELMLRVNQLTLDAEWGALPSSGQAGECALPPCPSLPGWQPQIPLEDGLLRI